LRYELELDLEQAVFGTDTRSTFPPWPSAKPARVGRRQGTTPKTCDTCHGQGQVRVQQSIFTIQQPCPRCKGRGKIIGNPAIPATVRAGCARKRPCPSPYPPGVDTGDRIRLNGEGEAGRNGGPAGDLYVEVRVREHAIFEREGSHLSCEVRSASPPPPSALGGGADAQRRGHPEDTQRDSIRACISRARKGVRPVRGGAAGDLFCKVVVETPVSLGAEQKRC